MSSDTDPQTPPPTFEQALARLEQIVGQLEDGRVDLADSLARYEEGVGLLKQCHSLLRRAERKIELLTGVDSAGQPVTEPFDDQSTLASQEEGGAGRSKKRTAKRAASAPEAPAGPSPGAIDEPGSLF